jgi:hypothetical protein
MSMLTMLKEGGSLGIDTIGNKPIDEDLNITDILKFVLSTGTSDNIQIANNSLKFIEYNGTTDNISTLSGTLSFTKADGSVDDIQLIK